MKQVDLSDIGVKKSLFDDLKTPDINGIIVNWSAGCQVVPKAYWLKVITHFKDGQIIDFSLQY